MRRVRSGARAGEVASSLKRVFRQNALVAQVASAVVLAVVAMLVQRAPSFAATAAGGVTWNPGPVDYNIDNSGCHTTQSASIQADTAALATTVRDDLTMNWVKSDFPIDGPLKVIEINNIQLVGSTINLSLDGWPSNGACSAAAGAGRAAPWGAATAQATGLRAGSGAGATTPAVNLDAGKGIQLASATWTKAAVLAVAAVAIYAAVAVLGTAGIVVALGVAGVALEASTMAILTATMGCIAGLAAAAVAPAVAGIDPSWQARLGSEVGGCFIGSGVGLGPVGALGTYIGNTILAGLGAAPAAIVGANLPPPATLVGIELNALQNVIQGTAAGASAA